MLKKTLMMAVVALIAVSVSSTGYALEKTKTLSQVPETIDRDPGPWGATDYCTLSYYNICAGWIYVWSGWSPSDVAGIEVNPSECPPKAEECASVLGAWVFFLDGYPSYGFTASGAAFKQGDQPGHLGKATHLGAPAEYYDGWNFIDLNNAHVRGGGVVAVHFENPGTLSLVTDGRPQACTNGCLQGCPLPARSYYYGSLATGNFSGSPFNATAPSGNTSDTDLLIDVIVCCLGPTAVEPSSWGSIKAMYDE